MSNKTPYEIRAEMIELVNNNLRDQYFSNVDLARKLFEKVLEEAKTTKTMSTTDIDNWTNSMTTYYQKLMPTFPTPDEIIKQVNKLYSFVTNTK